jgi:DegV family protein with EDD domain
MFMVDTLEYLHRGGRIGGGKKFLGTALKIKPILEFEDGEIEALEQVRTKKKALDRMLEISKERTGGKPVTRASVIHADVMDAALEFKKDVQAVLDPKEIYVCDLSPAIGTHGGPGTLGVTFYTS